MSLLALSQDLKLDEAEHDIDSFLQLLRLLQIQSDSPTEDKASGNPLCCLWKVNDVAVV